MHFAPFIAVLCLGALLPHAGHTQWWPDRRNPPVPPRSQEDRYQPILSEVMQTGGWLVTTAGGASWTPTSAFASSALANSPSVTANVGALAVSAERLVLPQLSLGLAAEMGGFYVSRDEITGTDQLGVGVRGGLLRIGPQATLLLPASEQWFFEASVGAGIGPQVDWTPDGRTATALHGLLAAGFGMGRLLTQHTALVGQVRRLEGRFVSQPEGPSPEPKHDRWELRLGLRVFVTDMTQREAPDASFRR